MADVYVRAWNECDAGGHPIYLVDRAMTFAEEMALGHNFRCMNIALLHAISYEQLDAATREDVARA